MVAPDAIRDAEPQFANGSAGTQFVRIDPQLGPVIVIQTTVQGTQVWDAQSWVRTTGPIVRGDVCLVRFQLRVTQSNSGQGYTTLAIQADGSEGHWDKLLMMQVSAGAQWTQFDLPFVASRDMADGKSLVNFMVSYFPQTIEIARVELINYGASVGIGELPRTQFTYKGREADAPWRTQAESRIEQHRKGDLQISVVDAHGNAVQGAQVAVRMKRHAFRFGSLVEGYMIASDPNARHSPAGLSESDYANYRTHIEEMSNHVIVGWEPKWGVYEGPDEPRNLALTLDWLEGRGITARAGHVLWGAYLPEDVLAVQDDKAALEQKVNKRIDEIVTALKGRVTDWDLLNEPIHERLLIDGLGVDAVAGWFERAHAIDPVPMIVNEYAMLEGNGANALGLNAYEAFIRRLQAEGAPIGGVGFQGHFGSNVTEPDILVSLLDRFATLGLPIQITEFDINTTDEQLQADYTRDFLTVIFSHPSVEAFVMWGFYEPVHWIPNAAMVRRDWSYKPNDHAYMDLVKRQWWTNADLKTDASGSTQVRGFQGEYEVTVTHQGITEVASVVLGREGKSLAVQIE